MIQRRTLAYAIALIATTCICLATPKVSQDPETKGTHALWLLYLLSPENPWHDYLFKDGDLPLALYTLKQHLITADPTLKTLFEGEEIPRETLLIAFAAYIKAYGDTAWTNIYTLLETTFSNAQFFASESDQENTIQDIILALEHFVVEGYTDHVTRLWETVIREIPWFLDGMPAYIFAYMHPQTSSTSCECNEESLTLEMDPTPSLVPPLQLNRGPARCAEYTEHTDERWQESLKNTWDDEIKPLLKHAESTFKKFIKEIKGTPEFKKIKTKFDKAEQAFRAFRKNIVQDIKNHLKQKNTGQSNDEAA